MRQSTKPHAALLGAVCFIVFSGAVSAGPVTVEIHNPTDQTLRDAPVTFGQVFRRGDMTNGVAVIARDGLGPTQVDVKRRYDDGSVRFALLSTTVRELAPKGKIVLELVKDERDVAGGASTPPRLLATDFDAVVTFRFPDGAVRRAYSPCSSLWRWKPVRRPS